MYETMHAILNDLNKIDRDSTKEALEQSSLIQDALNDVVENQEDYALKLKCSNLLVEIWYTYPTIVSQASQ